MSNSNPFQYVGFCYKSASGKSVKIVAVETIRPGDHLFVSVKEQEKAMKGNKFVAKIYRLNKSIPDVQRKSMIPEANPEKLGFSLNLF